MIDEQASDLLSALALAGFLAVLLSIVGAL